MTRIAFILLAHMDPKDVIAQARRLTAKGDYVSIHFDGNSPKGQFDQIKKMVNGDARIVLVKKRLRCGWGEWSLVKASLLAVEAALASFPDVTHFYLLSGDCMPIKSAEYTHKFLAEHDGDFIECSDFFESSWIKTGLREDRLMYRHFFNERKNRWLFYKSLDIQRRLGMRRRVPADLQIMIGSQWWCLRRDTIEKILEFYGSRPDIRCFFATTWIPDETFFQTVVAHLIPKTEINRHTLTFLMFTDYGMPVRFYNDHYDFLLRQDFLFARKISNEALELRERLGALWQATGQKFTTSGEGPRLFRFLTGRGRTGRRFAPRFWESEGSVGKDSTVLLIVAKKWHIAKRLTAHIRRQAGIPSVDYLFNEEIAGMPTLGGAGVGLTKRHRHRRALLRLLFNEFKSDRLVLCVDPSASALIHDFVSDVVQTKILLIESNFSEEYLRGHIKRLGLATETTPDYVIRGLLPTIRADIQRESHQLRDTKVEHFETISEDGAPERNAEAIRRFLNVPDEIALRLAKVPNLFAD